MDVLVAETARGLQEPCSCVIVTRPPPAPVSHLRDTPENSSGAHSPEMTMIGQPIRVIICREYVFQFSFIQGRLTYLCQVCRTEVHYCVECEGGMFQVTRGPSTCSCPICFGLQGWGGWVVRRLTVFHCLLLPKSPQRKLAGALVQHFGKVAKTRSGPTFPVGRAVSGFLS